MHYVICFIKNRKRYCAVLSTENNNGLTEQEILKVKRVLASISEWLNDIMARRNAKDYAKSLCGPQKTSKKSLTDTSIRYNVATRKQILPAEPRNIRDNLPEDFKDIHPTDLWKILDSLTRTKFLYNEHHTIKRPRGRPKERGFKDTNRGGKPSSYYRPEESENVIKILTKPEAKRLMNTTLLESGLLYKFKKYLKLVLFHQIREYSGEELWDNLKPFGIKHEKERENNRTALELYLQKIKNLREEDLQNEAGKEAETDIIKHTGDEDLFMNTIAGFLGYTNIKD